MRFVVKPLGLLVILACLAVLGALAFLNVRGGGGREAAAVPPVSASPPPSVAPSPSAASTDPAAALLKNVGFEDGYREAASKDANNSPNARVTGTVADPWIDNSQWGDVTIHYAPDTDNPHGGKTCQRIEARKVSPDGKGHVQFAQVLVLPKGGAYNLWLWLRASEEDVPVTLAVRGESDVLYGTTVARIGKAWKRVLVTAEVPDKGKATYRAGVTWLMLMVRDRSGVTLWADDAGIQSVPAGKRPAR
jgi:hypothetical protein